MSADRQAQVVRDVFSQTLRRIRVERNLSQEELACLAEMHRTEISVLERGRREPRLRTLLKLSAALETPLSVLVAGIDWRPLVQAPEAKEMGRFHVTSPAKAGER